MIEIKRTYYLDKILKLKDKPFIKVLTGIRRSGKLTILNQYKTILKNEFHISADQIFSYDFNDYEHNSKYNWKTLLEEIIKKSVKNTTNYIFLDEIQEIDKFEKTLISLFESKNINFDIYIAGSNSKMFSTELATLLTGRTYEIFICPITFDELNNCERYTINLRDYLIYGGLGILMPIFDETILKQETLKNVLQDTITKDICVRHKLHYSEDILKIIRFSFKNIGRVISAANIENFLISNKETKITSKTIINYLNWITESSLLQRIKYFNAKTKEELSSKSKYYAGDLGILSSIIGFDIKSAKGYRLENLIFLELKRRGYEIFTYAGKNNYEIDFVAKKMDTIIYYQITDRLSDENYIREIRSLLSVNDNYEKIILTNEIDENLVLQPNGIKIFLITEWLKNN